MCIILIPTANASEDLRVSWADFYCSDRDHPQSPGGKVECLVTLAEKGAVS